MYHKKLIPKIQFSVGMGILIFLTFSVYSSYQLYKNTFRLSQEDVLESVSDNKPGCDKIINCSLLPGDILIRRYTTSRTLLLENFAHLYFTHSAFYLGDDKLIEAVGTEKDSKDDVQISALSKSDWFNSDLDTFVVIRPNKYTQKLAIIKNNLIAIANDPDYTFGFPKIGTKRTTCADIIFEQLINTNVLKVSEQPKIITPDYLYWVLKDNPKDFDIVGYNLKK